jgi:hypothetical protein
MLQLVHAALVLSKEYLRERNPFGKSLLTFIGPTTGVFDLREDMQPHPFALPKAPPTQVAALPSKAARNLLTCHPEGSSHPPAKQVDLPRVPGLVHWPILYVPPLQPQRLPRCWRSTQILQLLLTRPRASPATSIKLESL